MLVQRVTLASRPDWGALNTYNLPSKLAPSSRRNNTRMSRQCYLQRPSCYRIHCRCSRSVKSSLIARPVEAVCMIPHKVTKCLKPVPGRRIHMSKKRIEGYLSQAGQHLKFPVTLDSKIIRL
jgi:hypothetical protein